MPNTTFLSIDQGSSFEKTIVCVDPQTNQIIDLTGKTIRGRIKMGYLSTLSFDFTGTILIAADGIAKISLTPSQTSAMKPSRYVFTVEVVEDSTGKITRVLDGQIEVNPGVYASSTEGYVLIGDAITSAITKSSPVNLDRFAVSDSQDGNLLKGITWSAIKTALAPSATIDTTDASNISSGFVSPARLASGTALQVLRRNAANTGLEFATFNLGGDMIGSNNLTDVSNPILAFSNIKQPATTTATGVVILAASGVNISGAVVQADDSRLSDSRDPLAHTHPQSDVTNLVNDLAAKVPTTRTINGQALSADISLTKADIGLSALSNDLQLKASDLDIDGSLTANSDTLIASQKAVKTYVDANVPTSVHAATEKTVLVTADEMPVLDSAALFNLKKTTIGDVKTYLDQYHAPVTIGTSLLKSNGSGGFANAVAETDYAPATSGSVLLKGNGTGGFSPAVVGTDYVAPGGALGTPSSATLTNAVGLPISTGISGLGTGVAAALGSALNATGGLVQFDGNIGTPSAAVLTNATGLPDGGLTLSDVATNNASTTKHGFLPKLSGNTTDVLKGDGTFGSVSSSGLTTKVGTMPTATADAGSDGQYAIDGTTLAIYVTGTGWLFFSGYQI